MKSTTYRGPATGPAERLRAVEEVLRALHSPRPSRRSVPDGDGRRVAVIVRQMRERKRRG